MFRSSVHLFPADRRGRRRRRSPLGSSSFFMHSSSSSWRATTGKQADQQVLHSRPRTVFNMARFTLFMWFSMGVEVHQLVMIVADVIMLVVVHVPHLRFSPLHAGQQRVLLRLHFSQQPAKRHLRVFLAPLAKCRQGFALVRLRTHLLGNADGKFHHLPRQLAETAFAQPSDMGTGGRSGRHGQHGVRHRVIGLLVGIIFIVVLVAIVVVALSFSLLTLSVVVLSFTLLPLALVQALSFTCSGDFFVSTFHELVA